MKESSPDCPRARRQRGSPQGRPIPSRSDEHRQAEASEEGITPPGAKNPNPRTERKSNPKKNPREKAKTKKGDGILPDLHLPVVAGKVAPPLHRLTTVRSPAGGRTRRQGARGVPVSTPSLRRGTSTEEKMGRGRSSWSGAPRLRSSPSPATVTPPAKVPAESNERERRVRGEMT